MLEANSHAHNCFATWTYKEAPPELAPVDMKRAIRRLRDIYPAPFRYYGVGEYGEVGLRPHYHLALFGVSFMDSDLIAKAWDKGFVHVGELNIDSAKYIAGYVLKKMTSYTNPALEGKQREFARMSLKPGIGALECENIGKRLKRAFENGAVALDVPGEIRQAGRKMPVGRYVQSKMREAVGWEPNMPQDAKAAIKALRDSMDPVARDRKRESNYRRVVGRSAMDKSRRKL